MLKVKNYEFWFVTGSQPLYGPEVIDQVKENSKKVVEGLNESGLPYKIVFKTVTTDSESVRKVCNEANVDENCAGIITWMHTFSPAKNWIHGLSQLRKPMLHLRTQFNREIPWDTIDMDFMNLNQAAHGDREFGHICARLHMPRKIVVGYWKDADVCEKIAKWMAPAIAFVEGTNIRVARFGDNMRNVAVTDGDKIEAQIKFGWTVDYYPVGDLVEYINKVTDTQINELMEEYKKLYNIDPAADIESIREQAKIEIGMRTFLDERNYNCFVTNFQALNGMKQLPGLAAQHLMSEGYGFGAEGDWKTAALVRAMKIMADGKGTGLMEDYTYNLAKDGETILGAHMLEVCPTLSDENCKPTIEVHPLGIGDKEPPARLVFKGAKGHAVAASLIDMGNRFRLIVNSVDAIDVPHDMPNLPVASVLWKPQPSLKVGAEAWILAGGAHHTSFSFVVDEQQLIDWAEMTGIECVIIDNDTKIPEFKNTLRLGELTWK